MPDTIRSLAELNALFADNGAGAITPQDIRDLVVSTMVHGEIGSGAKSAVTPGTSYVPLDFGVAGAVGARGVSLDLANRMITGVPCDLKATVHLEVMFRGAQNNTYDFTVFRNPGGTGTPASITRMVRSMRPTAAADIRQGSWSTSVQLSAGDTLQAMVKGPAGATFELLFGVLRVQRIGVE